MQLGRGAYSTPYGSGAQTLTVDRATVAGDVLVAIFCSQVTAGSLPTWAVPAGFTKVVGPQSGIQTPSGLFTDFLWVASMAPGAQPAGTVYSFTHGFAGRTIVLLFRASQALVANVVNVFPAIARGAGSFGDGPASTPATVGPVAFVVANPGFDMVVVQGLAIDTQGAPGADGPWVNVALFTSAMGDSIDLALWVQPNARNGGFSSTVGYVFSPSPSNNGWTAYGFTVQLGVANVATSLTFPVGLPQARSASKVMRLSGGHDSGYGASVRQLLRRAGKLP